MKGLAEFTKTTLIGGLLVVLPIYLSILLLAKTLSGILALLSPVTAPIPAGGSGKPTQVSRRAPSEPRSRVSAVRPNTASTRTRRHAQGSMAINANTVSNADTVRGRASVASTTSSIVFTPASGSSG